jgi:hypothetical protein
MCSGVYHPLQIFADSTYTDLTRAPMGAGSEKRGSWQTSVALERPAFLVLKLPRFVFIRLKVLLCLFFVRR